MEQDNPDSAAKAKPGGDAAGGQPRTWWWAEASIWTDRMVSALGNGVKGGKSTPSSRIKDCSPLQQRLNTRDIPDAETSDWRAVCGRTARTVRREGRPKAFPTPIED